MEPAEREIMVVAFIDAWYVLDLNDKNRLLSGPYHDHADAIEYCRARYHRIAKGWNP